MQFRNSAASYGLVVQSLHWLTVVLVVVAWLLGQFADDLPKTAEPAALFVHMTAGLLVIVLLAMRLGWRAADSAPAPMESSLGWLADKAAAATHVALYALLIAVPVAGIVLQFARGHAVPLFGLGEIASPWAADRTFSRSVKEVHEVLANALMVLAVLHAAAALVHHWFLHDRTLRRMLPGGVH